MRIFKRVLISIIIIITLLFIGKFLLSQKDPFNGCEFNKNVWRNSVKSNDCACMVNDLIANVLIKGLTKDSVLNLIGQPNEILNGDIYYVGTGLRWGWDVSCVIVHYSDSNCIDSVELSGW